MTDRAIAIINRTRGELIVSYGGDGLGLPASEAIPLAIAILQACGAPGLARMMSAHVPPEDAQDRTCRCGRTMPPT